VSFERVFEEHLYRHHVLLAAPQSQDTPRSALDAMAAGQTIVAYDTCYYQELAKEGAAIELVPWRDFEAMGRAICALTEDRARLRSMIERNVAFARSHTQEAWLDRRVGWTRALFA
jgi:glycosyltransferase involved in cell wall biosynthesis